MNITRQQQLLSNIKRIVSTELLELDHEQLHSVVVTHVLLSNDGRECRVYVDASDQAITQLNTKLKSDIQRAFMKKFARKIVPQLTFIKDTGEIDHIEALLESERTDQDE